MDYFTGHHQYPQPPYRRAYNTPFFQRKVFVDRRKKRKVRCVSCAQEGHFYNECKGPFTSFGIIAIRRNTDSIPKGTVTKSDKFTCESHSTTSPDTIPPAENCTVLYLMIQRKDTMGFIDFIRGRYPTNDPLKIPHCHLCGNDPKIGITCNVCADMFCSVCKSNEDHPNIICKSCTLRQYLSEMTCEERHKLRSLSFEEIWSSLWRNRMSRCFKEGPEASRLFNELDIEKLLSETKCMWTETEFGFPKGRMNMKEEPFRCAIREFCEETGYEPNEFRIIDHTPVEESFTGTNKIAYKHVYYIAEIKDGVGLPRIDSENVQQAGEIKDACFMTFKQCMSVIRPYDTAKKQLLERINEIYKNRYA